MDLDFWFDPDGGSDQRLPFKDVHVGVWYYSNVKWAYKQGIVNGVTSTSFCPDDYATRGEIVTMLYRMAGSPATSQSISGFQDAAKVASYAKNAMAWAVEVGLISGYEDNTLRPESYASRAEVCALMMRYQTSF